MITGSQGRDDDFLGVIHRLGLPVSVTSFQKHTVSQIKANLQSAHDRYMLLVIFDEPETDGFEAAKTLLDSGMTGEHIVLMFTSKDPKGHYSRCVDMGIDHLLVKPFARRGPVYRAEGTFSVTEKRKRQILSLKNPHCRSSSLLMTTI